MERESDRRLVEGSSHLFALPGFLSHKAPWGRGGFSALRSHASCRGVSAMMLNSARWPASWTGSLRVHEEPSCVINKLRHQISVSCPNCLTVQQSDPDHHNQDDIPNGRDDDEFSRRPCQIHGSVHRSYWDCGRDFLTLLPQHFQNWPEERSRPFDGSCNLLVPDQAGLERRCGKKLSCSSQEIWATGEDRLEPCLCCRSGGNASYIWYFKQV